MIGMDQYECIRTAHRVYQKSIREIARETGHHRRTIRKVLAGIEPSYHRSKTPGCRGMDSVSSIVESWLKGDSESPRKQRHTARRIYHRLGIAHYLGRKRFVSHLRNLRCEHTEAHDLFVASRSRKNYFSRLSDDLLALFFWKLLRS